MIAAGVAAARQTAVFLAAMRHSNKIAPQQLSPAIAGHRRIHDFSHSFPPVHGPDRPRNIAAPVRHGSRGGFHAARPLPSRLLLNRHGLLTRGAVAAEGIPGGFATLYKVPSTFEDDGRCQRGYFG
jgi:hypothetical protein